MSLRTEPVPMDARAAEVGTFMEAPDEEPGPERDALLARYRRLRAAGQAHILAALRHASRDSLLHWSRRLGVAQGQCVAPAAASQMALVADLAVHAAPNGRPAAIERYRKLAAFPAGGEDAEMLEAMCRSRFCLLLTRGRHRAAGLTMYDLVRRRDLWLLDEELEARCGIGTAVACRLYEPDAFCMTSGAAVPVGKGDLGRFIALCSSLGWAARDDAEPWFVEMVYRVALATGPTNSMRLQ